MATPEAQSVDKSVEGEAQVQQGTAAPEQPQAPNLDLQDLAMVLNLLNIAIKRGTFEPSELASVGTTYSKLEAFLQYQAQLQAAAKAQQGDA